MKIYLNEITDQETELDLTDEQQWVVEAVQRVDESSEEQNALRVIREQSPSQTTQATRPVHVHFSLRKVDEIVVLSGSVDTYIQLVCSRCANPFRLECHPTFSALFCKDPVMAGVAHLERPSKRRHKTEAEPAKPAGQNKGFARHAHDFSEDEGIQGGRDLDITYLSSDTIDLGDVLTEQLQFQVPFQPLCKENCKGICSQCGADLNTGRCACSKINSTNPFSALRDLKL